jgi:hypothetical protein
MEYWNDGIMGKEIEKNGITKTGNWNNGTIE